MNKLSELKLKKEKYLTKLKEKRLNLGFSDGAMISRYPTGRFELEEEIAMYEGMVGELQTEIDRIEKV